VGDWLEADWGRLGSEPGYVELKEPSAAAFQGILREFNSMTELLSGELSKYLSRNLSLTVQAISNLEELGLTPYARQRISIRRLLGWVNDDKIKEVWATYLLRDVKKEHGAVGLLRDDPNGAVVILYSGSMARYAREGLIELFQALERPAILIATSAVEVGVDFAADALITEECPASGFLQRFGRVGRRPGLQSLVHVLVSEVAYRELEQQLNNRVDISREEFSNLLSTELKEGFQERKYLDISRYAEAAQRMITRQLGQVGEVYLTRNPALDLDELASNLNRYDIDPAYGLRGTLPGVSLADSGVSKDPFYILSYVTNDDLEPPSNPFEVAQIRRYFNELIYKSWQRSIIIDMKRTLEGNRVIILPENKIVSVSERGESPAYTFLRRREIKVVKSSLPPKIQLVLLEREYELPPNTLKTPNLILGYGDVYLTSEDKETQVIMPVETYDRKRLRLPDQWYLILLGCDEEQAKYYLQLANVGDFDSEVYYDFEGVKTAANDIGVILLDRQAGAVWELWRSLRKVMRL
jgi:DEAD/DEAH box helicase domain-containing protein